MDPCCFPTAITGMGMVYRSNHTFGSLERKQIYRFTNVL
jgi:hypothetical protein